MTEGERTAAEKPAAGKGSAEITVRARELITAEELEREHQMDLERLKRFCLLDDEFMRKVFDGDPQYIQIVLRTVLKMPDLVVIHVATEVFVENLLHRSVRLDVLATDGTGRKFNVEIQRSDSGAESRRARYNSSMLDAVILQKGRDFRDLPETWVIFITEHDLFGEGWALYPVERTLEGLGKRFDDGAHILYVNGAYRGDDDVGRLMHDFACRNPDEMYDRTLAERVRFFKEEKEGIAMMCESLEEMRERYVRIGKDAMRRELALCMLKAGRYTDEEITELSGLTLTEFKKLKAEAAA